MTDCANILKITFICALKATTHTKPSLDANDLIQWKKESLFKHKFSDEKYYDRLSSTLIPVPRFVPIYLHQQLLKTDISKMLIGVTIVDKVED
jgi:hypothetical protein